jgi:hypothetical protein
VTPEHRQKIEAFYHSALGIEEGQRAEYLRQVCAGDDALRQEVESLLTAGEAMTSERWQRVEQLCNVALECEASQGGAFLTPGHR